MIDITLIEEAQQELCKKFKVELVPAIPELKVGIADGVLDINKALPINGLRHPQENGTSGWFIWKGEFENSPDFFKPMHISHLYEANSHLLKYLGLPPGWRFLFDENHEDVWFDKSLLKI